MLYLVLGGVRSGKSAVAERLAAGLGQRVVYLAPGRAADTEMAERIRRHRERRDPAWQTVEEPLHIAAVLRRHSAPGVCFLLDGLGTWVSNLLLANADTGSVRDAVAEFMAALAHTGAAAVVVSDEAGLGMVATHPLGRRFQDDLGEANQLLAGAAAQVLLVIAGLPIDLKALAVPR